MFFGKSVKSRGLTQVRGLNLVDLPQSTFEDSEFSVLIRVLFIDRIERS